MSQIQAPHNFNLNNLDEQDWINNFVQAWDLVLIIEFLNMLHKYFLFLWKTLI